MLQSESVPCVTQKLANQTSRTCPSLAILPFLEGLDGGSQSLVLDDLSFHRLNLRTNLMVLSPFLAFDCLFPVIDCRSNTTSVLENQA